MSRAPSDAGFSLVESMVALAVFALAGVGLTQLQANSLQTLARVEARALGELAVQNAMVEFVAGRAKPDIGARSANVTVAGRQWRLDTTIIGTSEAGMRRVSVVARALPKDGAEPGPPVASMQAFFGAPKGGAS